MELQNKYFTLEEIRILQQFWFYFVKSFLKFGVFKKHVFIYNN